VKPGLYHAITRAVSHLRLPAWQFLR
jgi:hypothetical protein